MTRDELEEGLAEVLGTVAGIERADVAPERSFTEDLGIDSLTMVEVVVAAEDRFGVLVPDDDWARFTTVGDALRYLEQSTTAPPWTPPSARRGRPAPGG
ncbi:acyl carrier protein [Geodermatophilus siccatus]|uniref:Acyl carrier protein n=1 Tax=Geodermatophilus siccatus TaxID=1137991 RepID=A0A1G9MQ42_9ACTN|nr:acyl carrier protein [Geodermatophilus siccatus]SDL76234.1 acyl carrier protein [Geodermatophilus siccatus]